jgi:hypothetical protein
VWACVREQVGQALLALFAQQYVHLDLKWDNVVVRGGATAADPPLAVVRDLATPWTRTPSPPSSLFMRSIPPLRAPCMRASFLGVCT